LQRELIQSRESISLVSNEAETSRREANTLRLENTQLRTEVARLNGFQSQGGEQPRINGATHLGDNGFNNPQYDGRSTYASGSSRLGDSNAIKGAHSTSLPPIRALPANAGMGEDMTGVQYNDAPMHLGYQESQPHRANGYPQNEPRVNGFPQSEQSRNTGFQRPPEPRPVVGFQQPQRSF
jgi:hypothetical protein